MAHFYILYCITNKINGKFYIGVHQTENIHDDYYGSGKLIKAAIAKYGIENFNKEILHVYTKKSDAYKKEKELVTEELVKNKQCYNIKEGGRGGFDHIRRVNLHFSSRNKKVIHNPITNQQTKVKPEDIEKYIEEGWILGFKPDAIQKMSLSGKTKIQSKEHKQKNSEAKKNSLRMHDPKTGKHKFVKLELVEQMSAQGWQPFTHGKGYKSIYFPLTMEQKRVSPDNLNLWLDKGWCLGFSPQAKANMSKKL